MMVPWSWRWRASPRRSSSAIKQLKITTKEDQELFEEGQAMSHSQVGDILEGTVVRVYPKYAIMLFDDGETGLLHISELSNSFVRNFTGYVQVGNIYKVKVIAYDEAKSFMKVSLKQFERRRETPTA
jgi:ribosomal protein S1